MSCSGRSTERARRCSSIGPVPRFRSTTAITQRSLNRRYYPNMAGTRVSFLTLSLASALMAQRAFEADGKVIYEDAHGNRTNLGFGFNPVLTHDGRVSMIRGRSFGYGEQFDCEKSGNKNWVSVYNPTTKAERILFDRTIPFDGGKWNFCVFEQMQLSYDGSVLYLVSPVYATSGSLAIIHLASGSITFVPGVNFVYVIEAGPHRDELIYQLRIPLKAISHSGGKPIRIPGGNRPGIGAKRRWHFDVAKN